MDRSRRQIIQQGAGLALVASLPSAVTRALAQGGESLRIGALNPVTGAGSPYGGGMQKAIIMAANEVNALGGLADARSRSSPRTPRRRPRPACARRRS
jgi:branched-chain amino acid transport system substrate-binding protein